MLALFSHEDSHVASSLHSSSTTAEMLAGRTGQPPEAIPVEARSKFVASEMF